MSNTVVITLLIIGALLLVAMFYCMDSFEIFKKRPRDENAPYKLEPPVKEQPDGYPPLQITPFVMAVSDEPAAAHKPERKRKYVKQSDYWKRKTRTAKAKVKTKNKTR